MIRDELHRAKRVNFPPKMKRALLLFSVVMLSLSLKAQLEDPVVPLRVSFFAPYVVSPGVNLGTSFDLINREEDPQEQYRTTSYFSIRPEIGYFVYPGVHRNLIMETNLCYTIKKTTGRSYFTPALGLAYLLTTEDVEGSVNLGSGNIEHETATHHAFLPTLNLEAGLMPKRYVGYFVNTFYGYRMGGQRPNATLLGLEIGLIIRFNPKDSTDE